jgi:hypothetical protein
MAWCELSFGAGETGRSRLSSEPPERSSASASLGPREAEGFAAPEGAFEDK